MDIKTPLQATSITQFKYPSV